MLRFSQSTPWKSRLELTVQGDTIQVSVRKFFTRFQYEVKASMLSPKPVVSRIFPEELFLSLIGSSVVALGLFTALAIWGTSILLAVLGTVALGAAVVFWAMFLNRYENNFFFVNKFDGSPMIALRPDSPDIEIFNAFVEEFCHFLSEYDTGEEYDDPMDQTLAAEIRKMYRLKLEGIISEQEFVKAKAKFLEMEDWNGPSNGMGDESDSDFN